MPEPNPDTDRILKALRKHRANGIKLGQLADECSMRFGLALAICNLLVADKLAVETTADERPLAAASRVFRIVR